MSKSIKTLSITSLFMLLAVTSFAQYKISGIVKEENGISIPNATIVVKNKGITVLSDNQGIFEIENVAPPFTLVVSFVSFKTREIQIKDASATTVNVVLFKEDLLLSDVSVSSRRRLERVQNVPIPISVIGGSQVRETGSFNVNRLKELVPSVQLYSSNPRNTGINIRGIGSPFGLTNDGLDPGVGYYVDGVYFARPAATTLDFIDVAQIEVLRGPQGTLFGKNTTAGAFNITSRKASFRPEADFELSYGNYGYVQAKASLSGPLTKKLAARASFSGTQRDGIIDNIATNKATNDINNLGWRGQLLYQASDNTTITLNADNTRQRPDGYAQVLAGVVATKRQPYRQFNNIIADLGYQVPTLNAFDRVIDHDTPWKSDNDIGGASLNIETQIGPGTLTSTTAWRYWNWGPSNDRDFTGLQSLALSQNPTKHHNWSQEIRYAGNFSEKLSGVIGLFYINQSVKTTGSEVAGRDQWRFSQSSTSNLWRTDSLFEGYGVFTNSSIKSTSAAIFANADWQALPGFFVQPGLRFNYDKKDVIYDRQARGGKVFTDPAILAIRQGVYSNQYYVANADENNFTYHLTLSYRPEEKNYNVYATYSTSFKPVGVNVAGLPVVNGEPALDLSVIKPEYVTHYEAGIKSTPFQNFNVNATFYNTNIKDYQANVQSPQLGVNRGYIANAERVRVRGAEVDINYRINKNFNFFGSFAYTDGKYLRFSNAPLPLEETGATNDAGQQVAFKDISKSKLPGISKTAGSVGAEFTTPATFLKQHGNFFIAAEGFYRSSFSSSPSPSAYLNVDGYGLLNARLGFRTVNSFTIYVWGRNILNQDYYEQLLPAGGNAGHYAGVLGDPVTYGVTIRYAFRGN